MKKRLQSWLGISFLRLQMDMWLRTWVNYRKHAEKKQIERITALENEVDGVKLSIELRMSNTEQDILRLEAFMADKLAELAEELAENQAKKSNIKSLRTQ